MRSGIRAATRVTVDGPRVRWTHEWPVVLRPTGSGPGGERVHLVHAAGGPLGGDDLALSVDVAPALCTARRAPGPTVVSDRAALESAVRVTLAPGAAATVRETVVLGRHGQRGGRYAGALHVAVGEVPLLAHTTVLDGADAALRGPAGTAGARAVGTLVRTGALPLPAEAAGESDGVRWAWTVLDGPGAVLLAVGAPVAVTAVLDAAERDVPELDGVGVVSPAEPRRRARTGA